MKLATRPVPEVPVSPAELCQRFAVHHLYVQYGCPKGYAIMNALRLTPNSRHIRLPDPFQVFTNGYWLDRPQDVMAVVDLLTEADAYWSLHVRHEHRDGRELVGIDHLYLNAHGETHSWSV